MKILVIHGPNLPLLGKVSMINGTRLTLDKLDKALRKEAVAAGVELKIFQCHNEERMMKVISRNRNEVSGILISPGALGQSAHSLRVLLGIVKQPVAEVFIEEFPFAKQAFEGSVLKGVANNRFIGKGLEPYLLGLNSLLK